MHTGVKLSKLGSLCAVDTETTGLCCWTGDRPFMVTFCDDDGRTSALYWDVDPYTRRPIYEESELAMLYDWFQVKRRTVWWNAPFDILMLESIGMKVPIGLDDFEEAMFGMHCVNSLEPTLQLKPVADKYLNLGKEDQKDLQKAVVKARRDGKKLGWKIADNAKSDYWMAMELCLKYGTKDAVRTMGMWANIDEWMDEEGVRHSYEEEKKLMPIVLNMQRRGVRIDPKITKREILRNDARRYQCLKELKAMAPQIENFNSAVQLRNFIHGKKSEGGLELPTSKKTKTGLPSVSGKVLSKLDGEHPFLNALFKYHAACDANTDFFKKYMQLAVKDPELDYWVLHPEFRQIGPVTGRFACRNPNLQNVPNALTTRSKEPIQARTPFGPRPGCCWVAADYKQLEVRIFASVSQEETLLNAIRTNRDMHTECANKAWGGVDNPNALRSAYHALELDGAVTSDESRERVLRALEDLKQYKDPHEKAKRWLWSFDGNIVAAEASLKKENSRAKAKMLLFLKIFGGGANSAAELMDVPVSVAKGFLEDYDKAFPRISKYAKALSKEALANGYIINKFDRKLRVPEDKIYVCVNYMVQGSAASFIKNRMVAVEEYLNTLRTKRRVQIEQLLTIHDELVFEVLRKKFGVAKRHLYGIIELMQDHGGRFDVDLPLDLEYTDGSWKEKKTIKLDEVKGSFI